MQVCRKGVGRSTKHLLTTAAKRPALPLLLLPFVLMQLGEASCLFNSTDAGLVRGNTCGQQRAGVAAAAELALTMYQS